jgi:hypothetical protein
MPRDANEIYRQRLLAKLDATTAKALPLVLAADYESAENMIREVDDDAYGSLAMSRLYITAIATLGGENAASNDKELIKAMFERAVSHRENAYPMPHTTYEADAYAQGRAQDRAQVVREIGFDPDRL